MSTRRPPPEDQFEIEGYEPPALGNWDDFPLDALAIRDERRTALDVVRRIDQGRFVIDPDFLRGFVWEQDKQSLLIESVLMRIPLPAFYVAEDVSGNLIVVDGQQRLTTLHRFFHGDLTLWLPARKDLHQKRFFDLAPRLQNRVEDCQLHFYIIDYNVPENARLAIFERVNGGETLTRQQMRNAIYHGPATQFLREEAQNELFQEATGRNLNAKKMQDRELINRFCSFFLFPAEEYRGDMDEWLARGLVKLASLPEDQRQRLRLQFRRSMANNIAVFGEDAFRRPGQGGRRGVINASIFDVMSTGLVAYDEPTVLNRRSALHEAFQRLLENKKFQWAVSYGPNGHAQVKLRFELAQKMFAEVFDAH